MLKTIFKYFVELAGNPVASGLLRRFSKSQASKPLVRPFAKTFRINEEEMERPLNKYNSIHGLFTRKLREDARPINQDADSVISPVDGIINAFGEISNYQTFYIKEHLYRLDELLGSEEAARQYEGGQFAVIYLSPFHYHRVHYPVKGELCGRWALGEKSFPVNKLGEKYGSSIFSTNYRIISELSTDFGLTALIKVGALNINSIYLTNSSTKVEKGDELGFFSFGSTVILLFDRNSRFIPNMHFVQQIKMGEVIGRLAR